MEAAVCSYDPQIIVTSASGGKSGESALEVGALVAGCETQTIILGAGAVES